MTATRVAVELLLMIGNRHAAVDVGVVATAPFAVSEQQPVW